jgi:hypothetical protein
MAMHPMASFSKSIATGLHTIELESELRFSAIQHDHKA